MPQVARGKRCDALHVIAIGIVISIGWKVLEKLFDFTIIWSRTEQCVCFSLNFFSIDYIKTARTMARNIE